MDNESRYLLLYPNSMNTCCICQDKMVNLCSDCKSNSKEYQLKTKCSWIEGQCHHRYHVHCINSWLKKHNVCPLDNSLWKPINKCLSLKELACQKLARAPTSTLIAMHDNYDLPPSIWDLILKYTKELKDYDLYDDAGTFSKLMYYKTYHKIAKVKLDKKVKKSISNERDRISAEFSSKFTVPDKIKKDIMGIINKPTN